MGTEQGQKAMTMIMLLVIIISKLHIRNTDCIGDVGDGGKDLFISIQGTVIGLPSLDYYCFRARERKNAEWTPPEPGKQ